MPAVATDVFGDRLPVALAYAELLAGAGTVRGLIGPREVDRLWDRHLLNCAVFTDAIAPDAAVCDIGSGAGLPGLVVAIRRPDLHVTLVEPLLRRTTFLGEAVETLRLDNVEVVRARAEALHDQRTFDVVTSRAVAPLARLAAWSLPLCRPGGEMLAMKGASAEEEVAEAREDLAAWGVTETVSVTHWGRGVVTVPTTVVRVVAPAVRRVGSRRANRRRR